LIDYVESVEGTELAPGNEPPESRQIPRFQKSK
jgi:hypothetical protein